MTELQRKNWRESGGGEEKGKNTRWSSNSQCLNCMGTFFVSDIGERKKGPVADSLYTCSTYGSDDACMVDDRPTHPPI